MNTLLRILAGALVLILAALFGLPYVVDWDRYRGVFEEEATRVMGREVRVGGQFNLRLLPAPYFSAEKVRIADTTALTGEPFFKADSFTLWLSVSPLLRGVFEARDVEIKRPVLHVIVDGEGRASWRTVAVDGGGVGSGSGVFRPKDVALQSVRISDGAIVLHNETGAERGRIEAVNGDLAAPALEGPYRIKATFDAGAGQLHEFRLSTAKPDPDGSVRFKAILRNPASDATVTIDARALSLMERPAFDGTFAAELTLPRAATPLAAAHRSPVEIKSSLKGDLYGATLASLTATFEHDDRPQLLSGEATFGWRQKLDITAKLGSQWLDLDKLAPAGDAADPIARLVRMVRLGEEALPAGARAAAEITLDQANIGGDVASGVRLAIVSQGNRTDINEFRANLPGGARLDLNGRASGAEGGDTRLDGNLTLRGASFVRFLSWAAGHPLEVDAKNDGAFALAGRLNMAADAIMIADASIEMAGTRLAGEIGYDWRSRRKLRIALEGPQIDARSLLPAAFGLKGIRLLVTTGAVARDVDAQVQVRSARLLAPDRVFQDFEANFDLGERRLRVDALRFKTSDGVVVDLEGDLADPRGQPNGTVRGVIGAESAAALNLLGDLLDLPAGMRPDAARAQAMAPLRLAAVVALGARAAGSADVTLDGEAGSARVTGDLRLDGGLDGWRSQPVDVSLDADAAELSALLRLPGASPASRLEPPGERFNLRVAGVPDQGLRTLTSLENTNGISIFAGLLTIRSETVLVDGTLTLDSTDAARVAGLLPGMPRFGLERRAIQGTAHVASAAADTLTLDTLRLSLDGAPVNGRVSVSRPEGQRARIDARLSTPALSVASLLAPFADRRGAVAAQAAAALAGGAGPWPGEPLDFTGADSFEGEITIDADRLGVTEGITLAKANVVLVLADGRAEVRNLSGRRRGAEWKATMRLERAATGGASISGLARVTGGRLRDAADDETPGPIEALVTFRGQGPTPRALVAALAGTGSIDFGASTVRHLTGKGLLAAIETALGAKQDDLVATLRREIEARQAATEIVLGGRRWPLELADGVLRLKPVQLEGEEAGVTASARVDLSSFTTAAEWRVEPPAAPQPPDARSRPPFAGVVYSYTGVAGQPAALAAQLNMQALERDVAVRKLERDVEELERLRRLDEQRAREAAALQRERDLRPAAQPGDAPATPPPAPSAPDAPAPATGGG